MSYYKNSGTFSATDLGPIYDIGAMFGSVTWYDDDSGDLHLNYLISSVLVDLNITDKTSVVSSALTGHGAFRYGLNGNSYYNGFLYICGTNVYDARKFNITTGETTLLFDTYDDGYNQVVYQSCVGQNNKIYFGCQTHVYEYDPATDTTTHLGNINSLNCTEDYVSKIVCDGSYVYVSMYAQQDKTNAFLAVIKLSDKSIAYYFDDNTTLYSSIVATIDGIYQYNRRVPSGETYITTIFDLVDGTPTEHAARTARTFYQEIYCPVGRKLQTVDQSSDGNLNPAWDYKVDVSLMSPWGGNGYTSTFIFATPYASGEDQSIIIEYGVDVVSDLSIYRLLLFTDSNVLVMGASDAYVPWVIYNYKTQAIVEYCGAGYNPFSPYSAIHAPSGYFIGAYPNKLVKYDPTQLWDLTSLNFVAAGQAPDEATTNPYATLQQYGKWPYYIAYDFEGKIWNYHSIDGRAETGWWTAYVPSDGTVYRSGADKNDLIRSMGVAKHRTKILFGDNANNILVYDANTRTLDKTITLTGYNGQTIVADVSDGAEVLVLSTDASSTHDLLKVNIDTEVITEYTLPAGFPFGYYGSVRTHIRFPKGPDGEYYLFLGTHLYSVDMDGNFTDLGNLGDYWMVTFAGRDVLLNDPSDTSLRVIYDMFWQTSGAGGIGTQATAGGIPGAKVGGL
jgi:hypothetical protein